MNCKFCNQPCNALFHEDIQIVNPRRPNQHKLRVAECRNHPWSVEYNIYDDGMLKYTFFVPFKGKIWQFLYLVSPIYALESFSITCEDKTVFYLDYFPNITPDNAFDKLSNLLVFL
jgi:hypothetical protein